MRGGQTRDGTLPRSLIIAAMWLYSTHQCQAPVLCTALPICRARNGCSWWSWPTLPTTCLTCRPQRKMHIPHNYFGCCFTWLALLSTKPGVNGFATAFGRPAQALCPTHSFSTFTTRYCHGLSSGVASRPSANSFIYRIVVFGRVNRPLSPIVLLSEQGVVMAFSPSVPSRHQADYFAFRHGRCSIKFPAWTN